MLFFSLLLLGLAARRRRHHRRRLRIQNDDLDDEFRKLWDDDDTASDGNSPQITPLPPILPPEDDLDNPRRVLQFPQYCCRCELRKKLE